MKACRVLIIVMVGIGLFLWVIKDLLVFSMSLLIPPGLATAMPVNYCPRQQISKDPTLSFFRTKDAYKVTWAHAVNNRTKLDQTLASDIMMLEADVQMRHSQSDSEPIMAHPPAVDSDLTLAQFIEQVSKTQKGMKLDFKSILAVQPSLKMLKNISDTKAVKAPIWLNANILMGPCFDQMCTPVDPVQFIDHCKKYFPSAVLSIGWTTGNDVTSANSKYTWENVIEMAKIVQRISQPITFPIRAALVKRSLSQLLWLLDISSNLTLTIWSSAKDTFSATDLVELRKSVYSKENVYYDLPQSQAEQFAKALEGKDFFKSNSPLHEMFGGMKGYALYSCSDVIVGETKIMFTGRGGWTSTIKELKATESHSTIHFDLTVSFLSLGNPDSQQKMTLVLGSKGLIESNPHDGIQVELSKDGEIIIIKPDGTKVEEKGVSDPKFEYKVGFYYGPNMEKIMISVTSVADYHQNVYIRYPGKFKAEKQYVLVGVGEQKGAVLVQEMSAALALPSGSGSKSLASSAMLLPVVIILFAFFTILFV